MPKTSAKPVASLSKSSLAGTHSFLDPAITVVLVLLIFAVFGQVSHFDFNHYDDSDYVSNNSHVQQGLTPDSIKWALTSVVAGHWGPLTLLSHIVVYQLFRLESGMHHLINVVFHALAAIFLFAALKRATGARWPSAFAALVFALHPLHVESVAWVSERKDVLSAFFWFLGLYAYVGYAQQPGRRRYLLMLLPFCLGLLSKTMLVTFPFTLLLFDVWPLRREWSWKLVYEKLPLFALTAATSVVAFLTQRSAGAVDTAQPFFLRLENSLVCYVTYLAETFWPVRLAVFYPYPDSIAWWKAAGALILIAGVSALAVLTWRTRPYLATGWFWYLGTLVPVIGLVQVGGQSHADHFTYIPMVGLTLIMAWGAADLVRQWPQTRLAFAFAGALAVLACAVLASTQTSYWQDGSTLFQHAMDVTADNGWAKYNLALEHFLTGNELSNSGRRSEAIAQLEETLRVRPNWAEAHNNLAILLANTGRPAEAVAQFEAAVQLDPKLVQAQRNLGTLLATMPGRTPEAIVHLETAEHLQPDPALVNLIQRLQAQAHN